VQKNIQKNFVRFLKLDMIKKLKKRWKKSLDRQDWRCTAFPNGIWKGCCVEHDHNCSDAWYYRSKEMRFQADIKLRNCANRILPLVGEVMYIGVRMFNYWKKLKNRQEY